MLSQIIKKDTVVAIKLLMSGEEFLAELTSDMSADGGDQIIYIRNPIGFVPLPPQGPDQQPQIGLSPFFRIAEESDVVVLQRKDVLFIGKAKQILVDEYKKSTSAVVQQNKKLITP